MVPYMSDGYVYLIAFDNGLVKVGRTRNIERRLIAHTQAAHNFGFAVTGKWVSPRHRGWMGNEDELIRLAHELGGKQTTPEYFKNVSFEALVERARQLSFAADGAPSRRPALNAGAILHARIRKFLTQQEVAMQVSALCAEDGIKFDRSGLSYIENGKVERPNLKVVRALAQVLDLEPDAMFRDDPDEDDEEAEAA
jgi:DNA-binding XRE family transcriptional regulator